MKNRINNIECRKIKSSHYSHEIVLWYPNQYYGKESDYELTFSGDFYKPNGSVGINISKSCFINPESCHVVAFLIKTREGFDLKSVGDRILDLSPSNLEDFIKVYKKAVRWKKNI